MNFSNDGRQCVESCSAGQYMEHYDAESTTFCRNCSNMCALNTECSGPALTHCSQCKHVHYQMECIPECPVNTFVDRLDNCIPCHHLCNQSDGCTGPTAATECHSCTNFTVRDGAANNACVEQCPPNYYSSERTCLQCDSLRLVECIGSGPINCNECLLF